MSTEGSVELAVRAAHDALSRSGHAAADLDVVVSCSVQRVQRLRRHDDRHPGARPDDPLGDVHNGLVVSGERITPIADIAVHEIDSPEDLQCAVHDLCAGMPSDRT